MKFDGLLSIVGSEPVFTSSILMAGNWSRSDIQLQLSRWVKSGKLLRLRRGVYVLARPYRRVSPHPFIIANHIRKASYVSLQSALAWYDMIPEYTPVVTSITTGRPGTYDTPEGTFTYRHIKKSLFHGYSRATVAEKQSAFIASPEKGLLDLVYLTPGSENREYLRELRLQNTERLDRVVLGKLARDSGSPKLMAAAGRIADLADEEGQYVEL